MADDITVLRLFAGWADSDLWYGGPVPYPDTGLSAELIAEMSAWSAEHYRRAQAELEGGPAEATDDLIPLGVAIARKVAIELGSGFGIAVDDPAGGEALVIHEDAPPRRPQAAAALLRWVAEVNRERREWDHMIDEGLATGATFHWTATSPPSAPDDRPPP